MGIIVEIRALLEHQVVVDHVTGRTWRLRDYERGELGCPPSREGAATLSAMISADELEQHRAALSGHCYRMLGSVVDAEDAVQETMVRAWRGLSAFDGRSSLRTWLHRIATNACLDALQDRKKRVRAEGERPVGHVDEELEKHPHTDWIEPMPEARVVPDHVDPAERALIRESVRLAFVAALQHLPPKQRAALLLTEVIGMSAAEVAESLDTSVASVNSALQRARATLAERPLDDVPTTPAEVEAELVDRYVAAFERYDADALMALLHEDAIMAMPPYTLWLQGHAAIRAWLYGRGIGCKSSRLLRTRANGAPAFAQYRHQPDGAYRAWALIVLELSNGRIARTTSFLDVEALFPRFGFPLVLPA